MEIERLLAIEASAGSGKTFALTLRYLALLFSGAKVSEILAITFTKKAAKEMRIRILSALKEIKNNENSIFIKELIAQNGFKIEYLISKRDEIYTHFISQSPKILTMDAFFSQILREFATNAEISFDFTPINSLDGDLVKEEFLNLLGGNFDEFVSQNINDDLFKLFKEMQDKHINVENAELRSDLDGLRFEILTLANEFKSNFQSQGLPHHFIKTATFKEFLGSLTWLARGEKYRDLKKYKLDEGIFKALRAKLMDYFLQNEIALIGAISKFFSLYQIASYNVANAKNELSFNQISEKTYELLMRDENALFAMYSRIKHMLVDEFQDTNFLQYSILKFLIDEIIGDTSRTLFFVGDPKQSIYGFRGSNPRIFDQLHFCTRRVLENNYRSDKKIVHFNNATFASIFAGYSQISTSQNDGAVSVKMSDDLLQGILQSVLDLQKIANLRDIAILGFKNDDLNEIEHFLNAQNIRAKSASKLKDRASVKILECCLMANSSDKEIDDELFYKAKIAKLLGLKYQDALDVQIPLLGHLEDLSFYIARVITHFNIGDIFAKNVLLSSLTRETISDLLAYIQNEGQVESQNDGAESDAIKLLTIHQSKGLEFKHVIVCDKFNKDRNDISKFIINPQDSSFLISQRELGEFCKKLDFKNSLCQKYELAQENKQSLNQSEKHNVLYVALTRAKNSLHIVAKSQNSAFGELDLKAN
ncbi:MAG: UvrD-helicase domain-containing protein [Helicobacter sp.]|nr:UvrD-helicase domain-containing protein [Helicobacter sp.]